MARTTIGLIADTHDEIVPWEKTGPAVAAALGGVSLILHCGDLTTPAVLDSLGAIAPVRAVRSAGDPPAEPPRLVDGPTVIDHEGVAIGLVNSLAELMEEQSAAELFPASAAVAVIVHGGTHIASVETRDGVLLVNPGSPSLADQTTVARLSVGGGAAPEAEIVTVSAAAP